ncbi:MAG: GvpL/GvpF family gas vesicle protein [Candidatus Atribacteria bacterium]|nr:GvpL/GvpF family gas vesicle protein [Candidatus Atribacteria bacterium]
MEKEGKYIYCIIESKQERNFGPIGIGERGDELLTIGYDDLSMVVSNHPIAKLTANRENFVGHEKAIEEVMKEFDSVLPVRFGTIASGADEIRNLLDRRYREFKSALRDMEHKVELGVKGIWNDMDVVFSEIVEGNETIKNLRKQLKGKGSQNVQVKINIGQLVKKELDQKKEKQAEEIVDRLRRMSYEYKLNKTIGDEMFMNAAFLVDKGREKEFDNTMDDLCDEYEDKMKFMYAGPLPVFNFVNILIYPEAWEK